MPITMKTSHTAENTHNTVNTTQMEQMTSSFMTTTPSAPETTGMSLKQANPVHVHHSTS